VNSVGCVSQIATIGVPSATSSNAFTILAGNVVNQGAGQLFYGFSSAFLPFQGGTLCLNGPVRMPVQFSNGSASGINCSGSLSYDFNARIRSGIDPNLVPGASITGQFYYRDGLDPFGSGLSNAVRFTICP